MFGLFKQKNLTVYNSLIRWASLNAYEASGRANKWGRTPERVSAIYDCPGGTYEPLEERSIFCTFIIINEKVKFKVKWSIQARTDEKKYYLVQVEECNNLPNWACKIILQYYENKNPNKEKRQLIDNLIANYDNSINIETEAKIDFLLPPND